MLSTMTLAMSSTVPHPIEKFKHYIVGDFDNHRQVERERQQGKPIHPYAKHVNRRAEAKIRNLPEKVNGIYVLEESYYKYDGQDTIIKPYLFFFEQMPNGNVRLHSLQLPKDIPAKEVRNDNPNLFFDYLALRPSPTFAPAEYTLTGQGFYVKAHNPFPGGSFTLEETIGPDRLVVMELLVRDGKQVTPYTEPIIYERL
jgi:hypothetical protein